VPQTNGTRLLSLTVEGIVFRLQCADLPRELIYLPLSMADPPLAVIDVVVHIANLALPPMHVQRQCFHRGVQFTWLGSNALQVAAAKTRSC
jgi:hypothetical protein